MKLLLAILLAGSASGYQPAAPAPTTPTTPTTPTSPAATAEQPPAPRPSPTPAQPKWVPDANWPFIEFDKAWPERVHLPRSNVASGRGVIREHVGPIEGWHQRFAFSDDLEIRPEDKSDAQAFLDALPATDTKGNDGKGLPTAVQFERRGGYVVSFETLDGHVFVQRPKPVDKPVLLFKYISGEMPGPTPKPPAKGIDGQEAPSGSLELQRTSFALYEPFADGEAHTKPLPAKDARGIALVMPGLFGTPDPVIDALVRRLREDRWVVLRLLSASSRFTEHVVYSIDPTKDMTLAAKGIGYSLGDRAAEIAYAVEAAFLHLAKREPELANLRRVVIGGSAGAITLSTVISREPEKYKAAVFVGGGVDFWLINYRSNYRRGVDAIAVDWVSREATDEEQRTLDELVLKNSPLDSFHTCKVLLDKPVFMLHGALDRAVPAALGDVLWQRIGKPRRVPLQVGHELLFAGLANRLDEIVPWLAHAVTLDKREPEPAENDEGHPR